MSKKNDKRLCWNCDGNVTFQLENCPYCGVDLSPSLGSPFQMSETASVEAPPPPYIVQNSYTPSNKEWEEALSVEQKEEEPKVHNKEILALLLLLPGIVLFLFGIALIFFSKEGIFSLQWNQNFAYFYFVGSVPLIFLGYKALR